MVVNALARSFIVAKRSGSLRVSLSKPFLEIDRKGRDCGNCYSGDMVVQKGGVRGRRRWI